MAADNNSFVRQDDINKGKKPSFEERKKDLKQYGGVKQVAKKENLWVTWLKDMFFSGRSFKSILLDVAENQVVPQFKDGVRKSDVSILDMLIYKDHKVGSVSNGTPGSFITNYVSYGKNSTAGNSVSSTATAKLEANQKKDEEVIQSGFECPAFSTKAAADNFLNDMKAYVTKYTTMSVLDLAYMQQKRIDYTWDKYGWEADEILAIPGPKHIANPNFPWVIELPKAGVLS